MKELNQHLKNNSKGLDFAIGILGAIKAYNGKLNPTTRRMIQGPIREINDMFTMEHTAKMEQTVVEAGFTVDKKLTCREWFLLHREMKKVYKIKTLHREHVAGGVKSMCDYLIMNHDQFNSAEDVLSYIVDNTYFVARHIDEKEINEHMSLEQLEKYL